MNRSTKIPQPTGFAHPGPGLHESPDCTSPARRAHARSALWVLGPLAMAAPVTLLLALSGATFDWVGAVWRVAVLWTIAASSVQALWQG